MSRIAQIVKVVAEARNVSVYEIASSSRSQPISWARQEIMYLVRELTNLSLPSIGRILGRDHTTILHGLRQVNERRKNIIYAQEISRMQAELEVKFYPIKFDEGSQGTPIFKSSRTA